MNHPPHIYTLRRSPALDSTHLDEQNIDDTGLIHPFALRLSPVLA